MNFQERVAKVDRLRVFFSRKNADLLAVDADDTLFDTSEEYVSRMQAYSQNVAVRSNFNPKPNMETVWGFMKEVLNGLRPKFNVHPDLMQETARVTALRFGCAFYSGEFRQMTEQLMEIYESVPQIFPGVHEVLGIIRETGIGMVVVTNSDRRWTEKKLAKNGLYQTFDRVINIPSHVCKDKFAWGGALNGLNTEVSRVLVVGDSWLSDIKPVLELGVPKENIVRVRTSYGYANQSSIEGITEVDRFEEVIKVWL